VAGMVETIEARVRDSKTGASGRFVNFAGISKGCKVPAAAYVRTLWEWMGVHITTKEDGGFMVERPDFSVARLNLLGMPEAIKDRVKRALEVEASCDSKYPSVAEHARVSLKYLNQRYAAQNLAELSKYVNVAGGPLQGPELQMARAWASENGFSRWVELLPGPFLRSSEPGSGRLTIMPMQVESTYTHHIGALKAAYEISSKMVEPDLELELGEAEEPHWANHSMRRFSDKVARESMEETGVTTMDIDIHYGWNEAKRRKSMQLHYEGMDRAQRVKRARVTEYV